jgi:hypothetical protein
MAWSRDGRCGVGTWWSARHPPARPDRIGTEIQDTRAELGGGLSIARKAVIEVVGADGTLNFAGALCSSARYFS